MRQFRPPRPGLRARRLLPTLLLTLLALAPLGAQTPEVPDDFARRLTQLGLQLDLPPEAGYRPARARDNAYLATHCALQSRRERTEIRYHLVPELPGDPYAGRPHLRAGTLALNLGSNDADAVTAVHRFEADELATLRADWARMYTFRPKRSYSIRATAQLVAVYRAGRGLAYTVLLFDEAPPEVDARQLALRFSAEARQGVRPAQ